MKTTEQLIKEGVIQPWLAENIRTTCPRDGFPIIRSENLTQAKCGNPDCIDHLKYRADSLIKYLGDFKNIGPAYLADVFSLNGYYSIFQVVNHVYKINGMEIPKMHLWEVSKFCYIHGLSNELETILSGYYTIDEYLREETLKDYRVVRAADKIREACKYVTIKPPLSKDAIYVMITGSISGFKNREMFIDYINEIAGSVVRVVLKGKNQSSDYLITEEADSIIENARRGIMNGKTAAAIKGGTPIVTPAVFMAMITEYVKSKLGLTT